MKLTSPAFADKLPVPIQYTCKGPNTSPPFEFIDAPEGTKSFALVVKDIDSPNQWIHWLVYNIPGSVMHLDEGKLPEGAVDGVCNGGTHGYEGPCPKYFNGLHRYSFRLYALNVILDVPIESATPQILAAMEGHVLATAELIGVAEGEMVAVG